MQKIMFNDKYGLTQAVLAGRKTQTRRIVSTRILDMVTAYQEEYYEGALESISVEDAIYNITHGERMAKAPFYVDEEVAVAQRYRDVSWHKPIQDMVNGDVYNASCSKNWGNKMFVRADLMPHRIKITNVRVERLQDISDEDCLKEGVQETGFSWRVDKYYIKGIKRKGNTLMYLDKKGRYIPFKWQSYETPREAFAALIDKTCGRGTWNSNPYVFVYDFELIK